MTCLLICAREAAPVRLSGFAMAVVATVGWIGMGLGSYQAGFFYDISANYRLSFANAAGAGVLNLLIVAALFWYRRERNAMQARLGPHGSPGDAQHRPETRLRRSSP
jgi:MFS family permease